MENRDLQAWLNTHDKDAKVECWVKIGNDELSHPNMATVPRDEIFEWQDKLDDIDYIDNNDENMRNLFDLIDDILDELESRLQVSPELIKELEEMDAKIEAGDMSDFVKVDCPERSFWDLANDFVYAEKIRDYIESSERILLYVQEKLPKSNSYIEGQYLYITQKDNVSISTSIIAYALNIELTDIDDRQWEQQIYRIKLEDR